jgi:hypothetical protein
MLSEAELSEVQQRIARGESLRPSPARLSAAREALHGVRHQPERKFTRWELGALMAASLLLTPLLAAALAWRWRSSPAGRQALVVALVGATFEAAIALRAVFA